ncbi:MAG: hypothetical protein HFK05_04290 [Clostridia bacterium]|nr:hypothetical protein [Clostridia bacterium]
MQRKNSGKPKKTTGQPKKRAVKKPPVKAAPKRQTKRKKVKVKTSLFKFRRYKKEEGGKVKRAKHPKLIVDEKKDNYGFMGLTESQKRGHHRNLELKKNPQKGKTKTAYLRDEVRYDNKQNFGKILEDYNLSNEDKKAVLEYLKRRKKKK